MGKVRDSSMNLFLEILRKLIPGEKAGIGPWKLLKLKLTDLRSRFDNNSGNVQRCCCWKRCLNSTIERVPLIPVMHRYCVWNAIVGKIKMKKFFHLFYHPWLARAEINTCQHWMELLWVSCLEGLLSKHAILFWKVFRGNVTPLRELGDRSSFWSVDSCHSFPVIVPSNWFEDRFKYIRDEKFWTTWDNDPVNWLPKACNTPNVADVHQDKVLRKSESFPSNMLSER